jgi:hypothetical protein
MKNIYFIILFSITSTAVFGQSPPIKWGKLSKDELELTTTAIDNDALAVVLCEYGEIKFSYTNIIIEKHVRLKVLKDHGKAYADVVLPYWHKDDLEKITKIRAQTLIPGEKGKYEMLEVDKDQFFSIEKNENWAEKRFTFPAVQVGAILEYEYTTISENFTFLEPWYFQNDIPTLHSELRAFIPEGLDYRLLMNGERLMKKYMNEKTHIWVLNDLPALREESFSYNKYDYAEKIRFQLAGYTRIRDEMTRAQEYVSLMQDWEALAGQVLDHDDVNNYLRKRGQARDILQEMQIDDSLNQGNLEKIFGYISDRYSWNGKYRIFPEQSMGTFLEKHEGNGAELNLLLCLLLSEAGYTTDPMLLSTRSHGQITHVYPLLSQFNHLVCHVQLGEECLVLDATGGANAVGCLPVELLGVEALMIRKGEATWEKLDQKPAREVYNISASIDTGGQVIYSLHLGTDGHAAVELKQKEHIEEALRQLLAPRFKSEKIIIAETDNDQWAEAKLSLAGEMRAQQPIVNDQFIYFTPYVLSRFQDNPFKDDQRYLPVEFPYARTLFYNISLDIPKGYFVDELPESEAFSMPQNAGRFTYRCALQGPKVQVAVRLDLPYRVYPPELHTSLRAFYDVVGRKFSEQIVIKKL